MRLRAPVSHDFIAHFLREGDVHQMIAVDVADLAFADGVFHTAKAVWFNRHAFPGGDDFCDVFLRAFDTHWESFFGPSALSGTSPIFRELQRKMEEAEWGPKLSPY